MKRNVLVILGMHRSGTSLIAQWLCKCGLNIGQHLLQENIGNVEGHFEDYDFLCLHEEILRAYDLSRFGMIDVKVPEISDHYKMKIKLILGFKNELNEQWGWKEPRTCLFLEYYRQFLPHAKYLVILRDCNSVVSSLIKRKYKRFETKKIKRKGFKKIFNFISGKKKKTKENFYRKHAENFTRIWLNYNEELLKHIQKIGQDNFILVNYKMLISQSDLLLEHLINEWRFDLNYCNFKEVYKEHLISQANNLDRYIKDKNLLGKVKEVEDNLSQFSFFKTLESVQ